jgi:hypothetical protein
MGYSTEWIGSNIIMRFFGEINLTDLHEANNHIYGDPRFDSMDYQIADYTGIESVNISDDDVKLLSQLDLNAAVWNRKVKVALIATEDYQLEYLNIYLEIMAETAWECRIFDNFDDAEAWCLNN